MKNILLTCLLFSLTTSCKKFEEKAINSKQVSNKIKKNTFKTKKTSNRIIYDSINNKEELKIWDTISKLPEVISQIKYVDKITNGKRKLQIWTFNKPNKAENYYWIKVSEDNGMALVAHFNFYVYPNYEIKYFDTANDSVLTLEDWRKM